MDKTTAYTQKSGVLESLCLKYVGSFGFWFALHLTGFLALSKPVNWCIVSVLEL